MAREVGIRDFREHLGAWLARIEEGEVVTLTRHGRPVARVSRAREADPLSRAQDHERIRDLEANDGWLPEPAAIRGEKTLSDYVSEGRR